MAKCTIQKLFFNDGDHTVDIIDECVFGEIFRTKREAEDYLYDMQGSFAEGAETLRLNNPGDCDEYIDDDWDDDNIQYEVVRLS